MARPAHQLIQSGDERLASEVLPRDGEIGGRPSVECAETHDTTGSEPRGAPSGLRHQLLELRPRLLALGDEPGKVHDVTFEDRVTIATPEGVDVDLPLAGLGSRFVATLIDVLIWGTVIIALALVLGGAAGGGFAIAAFFTLAFLILFSFDILFEVLNAGRTPGKAAMHLRVVKAGGQPVRFLDSAIRNLLRLVDWLPFLYAIGLLAILVSSRSQRLGDLAAGTLVVRERRATTAVWRGQAIITPPLHPAASTWDVSAVSGKDVATIRRFLERRADLDPSARAGLAWELARRVQPKVAGPIGNEHPEFLLEQVLAAKAARSRGGPNP